MEILIIEDEQLSASRLVKMILEYDQDIVIHDVLDSIEDSVRWIQNNKEPDLVFLDIHLADGESFSIFNEVTFDAPIIFTTAYNEYAIDAFKLNSIDYLLKPIKKAHLVNALKKYKKLQYRRGIDNKTNGEGALQKSRYLRRMIIKIGATIKSIEVNNIAYFYIQDKITFAVANDGSRYPLDTSLEKLDHQLDPYRFFRINRQFIISYDSISKMTAYSKSRIKILLSPTSDLEAVSSSEKTPLFRDWLDGKSED